MNRGEFASCMAYLGAGVGQPITPEQLEVYFDLLGPIDRDVFREAIRRTLLGLEKNFLPPAGVIHRHAVDVALKRRSQREQRERLERDRLALPGAVKLLLGDMGRLPAPSPQPSDKEIRRRLKALAERKDALGEKP